MKRKEVKELRVLLMLVCLTCLAVGCGGGFEKQVVPVTGIVKVDGNLVKEGYVTFTPIVGQGVDPLESGKAASGTIQSDGTFKLTTYDEHDGAVIGMHRVTFYKPDPEDDEQFVRDRFIPGGKELEVTVSADEPNDFVFELRAKGKPDVRRSSN